MCDELLISLENQQFATHTSAIAGLVVNQAEAETVRQIYQRYLKTGSVPKLKRELDRDGVVRLGPGRESRP